MKGIEEKNILYDAMKQFEIILLFYCLEIDW